VPPGGEGWSVALRAPDASGESLGTVTLRDDALAGSGQRLHGRHIVDPRGGDAPGEDAAAWAGAPSAALADALSTAFLILPPTEVDAVCRRLTGVWAILHDERDSGERLRRFPTHGSP
jgi:thiamine biosynthesis lipoprotein